MAVNIVMPKLGLTMTEGTISKWLKKDGEAVNKGEPVLEIITDKITNEVEAPESGVLKIFVNEGETVKVAEVIGAIAQEGEEVSLPEKSTASKPVEDKGLQTAPKQEKTDKTLHVKASPAARKMAEAEGINLADIEGTGPGGRIVLEDVENFLKSRAEPEKETTDESAQKIPLAGMRKVIAQRMSQSAFTSPHVTITMEVDMTEAKRIKEKLEESKIKITYTDILIKSAAKALLDFPAVNSSLIEENIIRHSNINIGIAVALDEGLIVPVIKDADKKTIHEISKIRKDLVKRAREGRLNSDEVTGGTFTITNLGMFGVEMFTPIINPPESAILGVGGINEKPVGVKGEILLRPMMWLSLSHDHRTIDGALAAEFLQRIKHYLENPLALLA
ncbi:MAG: hypothetical protein PWQ82_1654 [Thermosediminibacterales bacterium]|nr:hypothetical protein [Thermosediminibacterales bacterium]MDK2836149.1 hypothetical protein [Thermosediminibacterales bacterium]